MELAGILIILLGVNILHARFIVCFRFGKICCCNFMPFKAGYKL